MLRQERALATRRVEPGVEKHERDAIVFEQVEQRDEVFDGPSEARELGDDHGAELPPSSFELLERGTGAAPRYALKSISEKISVRSRPR
jgi:hypothetical protein